MPSTPKPDIAPPTPNTPAPAEPHKKAFAKTSNTTAHVIGKEESRKAANQIIDILLEAERHQEALGLKEKYNYLTEYGSQILCLFELPEGCVYVSRNFERITGHAEHSVRGKAFFQLIHSDYHQRLRELLKREAPSHKPHVLRCKMRHSNDKWEWYEYKMHTRQDGEKKQHVCVIENIHERIQTQNTLQRAKLEAELALRARSDFLANMSHDLRTPLNAVIGFSQLMDTQMYGKIDNPHYLEYIQHIQESGYDLLSKIEDLFDISSIDAGRIELERSDSYLEDLIQHVIHTQRHHAQSKKVTLHYSLPRQELSLWIDRQKIHHILGHLLSNAIRFSHAGGSVYVEATLAHDGGLVLRVRDNGDGMERQKLAAITSALKEENCWMAKHTADLGLGLALTKEFITMHGGQIKLMSKAGLGTSVYLTFPKECLKREEPVDMSNHPRFAHLLES